MPTYIADTHLLTPLGDNTLKTFGAYRAGISAYQSANYHTADHHLVTLALVPDSILPPLIDALEESELLNYRDERLLQMAQFTLAELLERHSGEPIPLILAGPENYPALINQLPPKFLHILKTQTELPLQYETSRTLSIGRAGVFEAVRLAQAYLDSGFCEKIIVGGVDCCQHSDWLELLDKDSRLKSESPRGKADSFVPAEGAAFLVLTNNAEYALEQNGYRFVLQSPGIAEEPGHMYSDHAYLGSGLDKAVKGALKQLPPHTFIHTIFSGMNGESYWAKEFGVAMTRSAHQFENPKHEHPADCLGDMGAATGAALIALAMHHSVKGNAPRNCLICCSSDNTYRAAICLLPERIDQ